MTLPPAAVAVTAAVGFLLVALVYSLLYAHGERDQAARDDLRDEWRAEP